MGGTNFSAAYDLPGASGAGNRARFGAETSLEVADGVTLGLRGSLTHDVTSGSGLAALGASARFTSPGNVATTGADVSVRDGALKLVTRAGVSVRVDERLTLGADGVAEVGVSGGARLSLGAAYRDGRWNALASLHAALGSFSPQPEVTAAASTEYHEAALAVRGDLALRERPADPGARAAQFGLGATWWATDTYGLGAALRVLTLPTLGDTRVALGLEAGARVLPGVRATLGFNLLGYEDGLGDVPTRHGAYLRLDVGLDERAWENVPAR
ncbi:hypothetical protein [Deinococcus pimensis]|uniref:hypothetical protein n=1 Tax=Deinococcus pimensis TaxID=309888 RepID=UPI000480C7B4|nr:hypothetical protein [Deinococcus pimensis]